MNVYPLLTPLVPIAAWIVYRWRWRRIRREVPQLEWLASRRELAAREQTSMAVGFLGLAVAGAALYGDDRSGAWVIVLLNAVLAVLCAFNARRWHRAKVRR